MSPVAPTPGRIVLVTVADSTRRKITVPAIITHVHSALCISVVLFSAFADAGTGEDGSKPMQEIEYDAEGDEASTWRWMDYQKGQAAKTDSYADIAKTLEERLGLMEAAMAQSMAKHSDLEAQLVALNQKQPASQRVPVTDPSLDVPLSSTPSLVVDHFTDVEAQVDGSMDDKPPGMEPMSNPHA